MNDEVIYNVKTIIRTNTTNEKELKEIFNEKLLKVIISFELKNKNIKCQV